MIEKYTIDSLSINQILSIYILWTSKPPYRGSRKKTPHTHILYAHKKCLFAPHAVKTIKEYDTHIHVHIYKSSRTYISALSQLSLFLVSAYFWGKLLKSWELVIWKGMQKKMFEQKIFIQYPVNFSMKLKPRFLRLLLTACRQNNLHSDKRLGYSTSEIAHQISLLFW